MEEVSAVFAFLSRGIRRAPLFLLSFGIALLFLIPASASATTPITWTVTGTTDSNSGTCNQTTDECTTLRAALAEVKKDAQRNDTVSLVGLTGTIDLTGELKVPGYLTIQGPGANLLTISGQGKYEIFDAEVAPLTISGLTLADGNSSDGGAIYIKENFASVTVENCAFIGNTAGSEGGAIYDKGEPLNVKNDTFSGNSATSGNGGAIAVVYSGSGHEGLGVVNSTFYDNSASDGDGGATYSDIESTSHKLIVVDSTFVGNKASGGGAVYGTGSPASEIVENDIFANNTRGTSSYAVGLSGGTVTENYNLYYENYEKGTFVESDLNLSSYGAQDVNDGTQGGNDPRLLSLGYYGGPTETMMPEVGSAAICAGTTSLTDIGLPAADQRGFPTAPANGACSSSTNVDMGSVQTNYLVVTSTSNDSGTSGTLPYEISHASGQRYADIGFDLGTTAPATINLCPSGSCSETPAPSLNSGDTVIIGPPSGVTLSGGGGMRVLFIGSSASATLYGLTFTDGQSSNGGAIYSKGDLTVEASTFDSNSAGEGGAIENVGILTVVNSTFYINSATDTGAAIYSDTPAQGLTVVDSTFVDNSAASGSGAIDDHASDNSMPETVENDIFAHNSEGTGNEGFAVDFASFSPTEGNNLFYENYIAGTAPPTESDTSLASLAASDVTGNPDLTGLGNFGGPTETMMPEVGSAAIGAGTSALTYFTLPTADQRGFPMDTSAVDIGSVQTNYLLVTSTGGQRSMSGTLPYEIFQTDPSGGQDIDIGFKGLSTDPVHPSTITLPVNGPGLDLNQGSTVIIGAPEAVTIDGGKDRGILDSEGPNFVSLYGLTFENGKANNGGAISNGGPMAVANCTFDDNNTVPRGSGGAIFNDTGGTLSVTNSTFYHNLADDGGGAITNYSVLTVTNSTFDDNAASSHGGAIDNKGGTLTAVDNIFDDNTAVGSGGGIYDKSTPTASYNLFHGNLPPGGVGQNMVTGDPELALLGDYGGPTLTMQPGLGGAAICAGTPTLPSPLILPTTDQRGFPRTTLVGSTTCVDIGSVQTEADAQAGVDYVDSLYSAGVLNRGQDNSLVREIDKAYEMASKDKYSGAVNNVNDFITEVKSLYEDGVLTEAQEEALLVYANAMLQSFPSP